MMMTEYDEYGVYAPLVAAQLNRRQRWPLVFLRPPGTCAAPLTTHLLVSGETECVLAAVRDALVTDAVAEEWAGYIRDMPAQAEPPDPPLAGVFGWPVRSSVGTDYLARQLPQLYFYPPGRRQDVVNELDRLHALRLAMLDQDAAGRRTVRGARRYSPDGRVDNLPGLLTVIACLNSGLRPVDLSSTTNGVCGPADHDERARQCLVLAWAHGESCPRTGGARVRPSSYYPVPT